MLMFASCCFGALKRSLAGVRGKQVTFLFTDNDIVSEIFLEDINSVLSNGDITGLFAPDEKEKVFAEMMALTGVSEVGGHHLHHALVAFAAVLFKL